jgi:RNA polymerase sigma-70 factor (ECF subfamily)
LLSLPKIDYLNQAQTISLYQPTLQAIAFRLLKCKADAEDMVQETFLKWLNAEQEKIQNTKAYLIKAVTNNCLNHLNTLKRKKEQCLDAIHWTEMVERFKESDFSHLDLEAEMTKAFRILQHKLEPLERAVYLLKEVFDFDYEALQQMLDKKQEYCRQLLCRAKRKLEQASEKPATIEKAKLTLVETFKNACDLGNASEFISELKKDIALAINKKSADLKSLL